MKKIICMLLVIIMMIGCVACSDSGDDSNHEQNQKPEGTAVNNENSGNDPVDDSVSEEHSDEDGSWYLEDREVNGWKFQVIHDPELEYEYDVPEAVYEDTDVTIAGEEKTILLLKSPFNCSYDELVAKMKATKFIAEDTKLYPYETEEIRYYDDWNKCFNEFARGFQVKENGRNAKVQTGEFGVDGTNLIFVSFRNGEDREDIAVAQDDTFEVLKELVGEKLATIAVYYSEDDDVESDDVEKQMSADHDADCDAYHYEIEREISVDEDGRVYCAEFTISVEAFTFDDELEALWQEYSKEETCDTKYADSKHNCFKVLDVPFEQPMSDANMKTFFEHCHDGSIGTRLDNFYYSHDLRWDKYDPDEEYFDMYCTYTNVSDNDNYARPYLQLNYTVFDDENGDTSFTSLSFNGWFDAFQTSSTDIGSDEWNAERNAAYQELCETGSRTLSMLLKKDVTLDIEKFEKDGEKMSIEFLVNSDVSGEDYEYTVTINLNYTSDPSENVYFWYGDLFVA